MITFTYSHFMRPWRVTDYLISQIFFVSMQRLSQFFSQSVNQSLSCALFEVLFSIVYATDEIRTNIDFSILTVTFSASAYEVFLLGVIDRMWIDLSLNLKSSTSKFILLQWGQGFCEIDAFYFLFAVVLGDFLWG